MTTVGRPYTGATRRLHFLVLATDQRGMLEQISIDIGEGELEEAEDALERLGHYFEYILETHDGYDEVAE